MYLPDRIGHVSLGVPTWSELEDPKVRNGLGRGDFTCPLYRETLTSLLSVCEQISRDDKYANCAPLTSIFFTSQEGVITSTIVEI